MFEVEWLPEAVEELAAIWTRADSDKRREITEATAVVDRQLQADPVNAGESRDDDRRVMFVKPLGVVFLVDVHDRVVEVEHIWHFRTHAK